MILVRQAIIFGIVIGRDIFHLDLIKVLIGAEPWIQVAVLAALTNKLVRFKLLDLLVGTAAHYKVRVWFRVVLSLPAVFTHCHVCF